MACPLRHSERPVGTLPAGIVAQTLTVSADRKRIAFVACDGQARCVVDGQPGPPCDRIIEGPHHAADGRVVYVYEQQGQTWIAAGQARYGPYDALLEPGLTLSPDGRTAAWVGHQNRARIVVEGDEIAACDFDVGRGRLVWNLDGQQLAYHLDRDGEVRVVRDGEASHRYTGIGASSPVFGPLGTLAYTAFRDYVQLIVLEGVEGPEYSGIAPGMPVFSASGTQVGYAAWQGQKQHVVIGQTESPPYDAILAGHPQLSPDGKRHAFCARQGTDWLLVVDGQATPIGGPCTALWSPDGQHLASLSETPDGWRLIRDGATGPACEYLTGARFSPDSQRLAWTVQADGGQQVRVDDAPAGPGGREAGPALFSPDSRRLAYVRWTEAGEQVVVDGVAGQTYDRIFDSGIVFDGPDLLRLMALRSEQLLAVEIHLP